jgi:hypothetical protein
VSAKPAATWFASSSRTRTEEGRFYARRGDCGDAEHGAPGRQRDGKSDDGADQHHP